MRKTVIALGAGAILSLMASGANALPLAPQGADAGNDGIILASGGCGPYRHMTPWGCRPNGGGGGWRRPGWQHPGWRHPGGGRPGWRHPGWRR